ncbi:MAG TPA: pyridoxal-phosphate dependent enzyme [Candidatus Nanoarchaeia archaeon]|nr:pyridoxal-phosphate dependent enzyme [Candidatus Nanoarchaeia archaeon]
MPMYHIYDFQKITGATHKDLGSEEIILDAMKRDLKAILVISSGNYIDALRRCGDRLNPRLKIYNLTSKETKHQFEVRIPTGRILRTHPERIEVVRTSGFTESIDDYTDFIPTSYAIHAREIVSENPDYVVTPIGSGKLWKSIVEAVGRERRDTTVIGIAPKGKNAFIDSSQIIKGSIADKLTAPYTKLAKDIADKCKNKHKVVEVTEEELSRSLVTARGKGFYVEASGAAGFVVFEDEFRQREKIADESKIVIVSTGRGLRDIIREIGSSIP